MPRLRFASLLLLLAACSVGTAACTDEQAAPSPPLRADLAVSPSDGHPPSDGNSASDGSGGDLAARGPVPCGNLTCPAGQACVETVNGVPPPPDMALQVEHYCLPVPAACAATPTCACLDAHSAGGSAAFCNTIQGGPCAPGSHGPDGQADLFCPRI